MNSEFFSATILLILVIDPFGNVPLVVSALASTPTARHARILLRECLIAYAVLLLFLIGGHAFLALMHLSETSLTIAGGVILFLIALRMVFSHPEGIFGAPVGSEPFVVPLAIPAIAGPSALATVMLMVSRDPAHTGVWAAALTGAMAVARNEQESVVRETRTPRLTWRGLETWHGRDTVTLANERARNGEHKLRPTPARQSSTRRPSR